MLQQILTAMAHGDVTTQQDLARRLDVPEPMISQMVGQLVQQGYLREGEPCAAGCEGCRLKPACGELEAFHVWTLTEKGRRAVQRG
jgi:DNA-binding IscR family transcriptional regulator